ncbi:MAG: heme biosynthesis protein HemY, partial [Burkholderiales bacterium]|nr:heme biosynthesis protein HemY [Burkholderiales bacterium]
MRWLLWIILLSGLAIGLILLARVNDGFVLLVTPFYRIELSLNLAIIVVLATVIAGYLLVRGVALVVSMPARLDEFRKRRLDSKERAVFADALRNYFEGRFGKAEKAAESVLSKNASAGLAALVGAWSAHGRRDYALRDEYLSKMAEHAPRETVARLMAQAQMYL